MAGLFMVVCDSGEHDNAREHVVCGYLTRESAELHVEHCTAIGTRFTPPVIAGNPQAQQEHRQRHWQENEARYLEAMSTLDPEALVVNSQPGQYRVEETQLLGEVPQLPL
jgi:hypothetical protein